MKSHCPGAGSTPRRGGFLLVFFLFCMAFAGSAVAATVPQVASAVGRELDRQVAARFGQEECPAKGVSLCITTPVDSNDLESSNALARQVQEEIARWFVQAGYEVQEIRKGADILFEPSTGEQVLTRHERLLGSKSVSSTAIVAGTYTITPEHVRFNIRVVRTKSRDVLAMSTMSVVVNKEVAALINSSGGGSGGLGGTPIEPTVVTLLP